MARIFSPKQLTGRDGTQMRETFSSRAGVVLFSETILMMGRDGNSRREVRDWQEGMVLYGGKCFLEGRYGSFTPGKRFMDRKVRQLRRATIQVTVLSQNVFWVTGLLNPKSLQF